MKKISRKRTLKSHHNEKPSVIKKVENVIKEIRKREPLFDKKQLKEVSVNLNNYKKILNPNMLEELLDTEIKFRMVKHYIAEKYSLYLNQIEKEYSDELKMIYHTLMPEKYKHPKSKVIVKIKKR